MNTLGLVLHFSERVRGCLLYSREGRGTGAGYILAPRHNTVGFFSGERGWERGGGGGGGDLHRDLCRPPLS